MDSITLTAPAKVNLFLKVLNRRKDGYHNILTIFERISLSDTITISKIPEGIKVSSDRFITADPRDNLVYKAAESILKRVRANRGSRRESEGVRIRIKKLIPIAAGLGGGSSDAASTLMGIDKLFNLKLKRSVLSALAKKLGADVPFFMMNAPFAIGAGRGDDLKKISCGERFWHLIIYPGFKLAAKDIYCKFDKIAGLTSGRPDVKIQLLYNDLEDAAIAEKRVLRYIKERLASTIDTTAIVSGSGPSVFCLCASRKEAIAAREKLFRGVPAPRRKSWQAFIVKTEV